MTQRKPTLTNADHAAMDTFIKHVLDEVAAGNLPRDRAMSVIAHVIAAVDIGNYDEARNWFHNPRQLVDNLKNLP